MTTDEQKSEQLINELESIYLISGWRAVPEKVNRVKEINEQLSEIFRKNTH